MPHRKNHNQADTKSRTESHKAGGRSDAARETAVQQTERERIASEQPSYDSIEETQRSGGSLQKIEHRADTARMSKRARGVSTSSAERSADLDTGPARGEAAGASGVSSETAAEQPSRGESTGISDASGGALDDDPDGPVRGSSVGSRARARDTNDLTYAGFSRPGSGESSRAARISGAERSESAARCESSGRDQEPTARGGFIEPDERTSGSSSRH